MLNINLTDNWEFLYGRAQPQLVFVRFIMKPISLLMTLQLQDNSDEEPIIVVVVRDEQKTDDNEKRMLSAALSYFHNTRQKYSNIHMQIIRIFYCRSSSRTFMVSQAD